MSDRPPLEIARETLKQLATRQLPPTPVHYMAVYDEIAQTQSSLPFPEGPLHQIARVLPGQTPVQKRLLEQFEKAVQQKDWIALRTTLIGYAKLGMTATAENTIEVASSAPVTSLPAELAEALARFIDQLLPALGDDDMRAIDLARQTIDFLRQPAPLVAETQLKLSNLTYRMSFATEDQAAIRSTLLNLLRTMFENIAVLSMDDAWLRGQAEALMTASTPPLSLRRLDDIEKRLKDVIFKQTEAKARTVEAQEQMKAMLSDFIDRLAHMTASSSENQATIERCAGLIEQATSVETIAPVLQQVMTAMRAMALDSRINHDELTALRENAEHKHREIAKLQTALDQASQQARHDPLTGSLNRKGLDEAIEREIARSKRLSSPLCVALIDIDNFKNINDRLGHGVGDAALVHLAKITREVMRPQDMLSRYGGEEFVIVMPDTTAANGAAAMTRLQRELTSRFFMQGSEKILITFSAGVAQIQSTESSTEAILRADKGMYLAKKSGKNRVVVA